MGRRLASRAVERLHIGGRLVLELSYHSSGSHYEPGPGLSRLSPADRERAGPAKADRILSAVLKASAAADSKAALIRARVAMPTFKICSVISSASFSPAIPMRPPVRDAEVSARTAAAPTYVTLSISRSRRLPLELRSASTSCANVVGARIARNFPSPSRLGLSLDRG